MAASFAALRPLALWRDRAGAFSPARAAALALAVAPTLPLIDRILTGDLGARPLTEVSHATGLWAIRLLAVTLAVTPLIDLLRLPRLVAARRILGVSVFVWMVAHFIVFVADKSFDPIVVGRELVVRVYLLIGLVAFLMLGALAATSTDGAIRRLGASSWKKLHRLVYVVALLGLVHFFMQSKLDVTEPTAMAGIFALLGLLRLPKRFGRPLTPTLALSLSVVAAVATALAEAGWFAFSMGAPFGDVLASDFTLDIGLRPCWTPLIGGAAFVVIGLVARYGARRQRSARSADGRASAAMPSARQR